MKKCTDRIKIKHVVLVSRYMVKKYGAAEAILRAVKKQNGAKIYRLK
jgi:hypothetical protein